MTGRHSDFSQNPYQNHQDNTPQYINPLQLHDTSFYSELPSSSSSQPPASYENVLQNYRSFAPPYDAASTGNTDFVGNPPQPKGFIHHYYLKADKSVKVRSEAYYEDEPHPARQDIPLRLGSPTTNDKHDKEFKGSPTSFIKALESVRQGKDNSKTTSGRIGSAERNGRNPGEFTNETPKMGELKSVHNRRNKESRERLDEGRRINKEKLIAYLESMDMGIDIRREDRRALKSIDAIIDEAKLWKPDLNVGHVIAESGITLPKGSTYAYYDPAFNLSNQGAGSEINPDYAWSQGIGGAQPQLENYDHTAASPRGDTPPGWWNYGPPYGLQPLAIAKEAQEAPSRGSRRRRK
jgi:hypothetical protein